MQPHAHLKALDGLRGVSIVLVATTHARAMFDKEFVVGILALSSFFLTSGFIITTLLLQEVRQTGGLNVPLFYVRRFFRLMPTLFVYVVVSIAVLAALGLTPLMSDIWAALFFYGNYHAIEGGFQIVGRPDIWSPLGITWSLGPEVHYYLLMPAVILLARKRLESLLAYLCTFAVAILLWRCYLVFFLGPHMLPQYDYRLYCASDTRLDSIAYGCILAVLFQLAVDSPKGYAVRILEVLQSRIALAVSAVVLTVSLIASSRNPQYNLSFRYTVESIGLMPLYAALFWRGTAPGWVRRFLESWPILLLGTMSYSIYLYHFGCITVVQVLLGSAAPAVQVSVVVLLALATGMLSYYLVEAPARRWGAALISWFRSLLVSTT